MTSLLPDGPIDTLGYRDSLTAVPALVEAAGTADPVDGLVRATDVDHVLVHAVGAMSGVGTMVAALAAPVAHVPAIAAPPGPLPTWVSARSLVVVVDVDDDPAAVSCVDAAIAQGAHVVALARPGASVATVARAAGGVVAPFECPLGVPRLGFGAAVVRVLGVLEQLGHFAELGPAGAAASSQLERRVAELGTTKDGSAGLARRVGRTLPIVYGTDALGRAVADRWKHQVNTGAKAASFASSLSEVVDDEIAGWGQHGDMTRQVFSLVVLRHDHEPDGTDHQLARVVELVDEVVHERHEVAAGGDGSLAQALDLVLVGDCFAYHLAHELEIDPGPVAVVRH